MKNHRAFFFTALVAAAGFVSSAHAQTADRCEIAKLHATVGAAGRALRCQARAADEGAAPSSSCSVASHERLVVAFGKADSRGGCPVSGNAEAVQDAADSLVDYITSILIPTPTASSCTAAKLRVVARAVPLAIACRVRAVRGDTALDAGCLADAAARLSDAFERVEARGDCFTQDDAPEVSAAIAFTLQALAPLFQESTPAGGEAPSDLQAIVSGADVHLTWVNTASGSTQMKLLRRLNAPPTGPYDPGARVIFTGTGDSFDDDLTALLPDTASAPRTYHYAVFACTLGGSCESAGSLASATPTVTEVLRAGGYVLYFRHALADVCVDRQDLGTAANPSVPDWWKSCDSQCPPGGNATARQLNATGVSQATSIGDAWRTRGLDVGRIISSEYCRCVTTAQLMAFAPPIEQSPLITFFVYDEAARCPNAYSLLSELPAPGTNTALIGHGFTGCPPVLQALTFGEAAIFKPDGAGGTELVTRVPWDGWLSLP